MTDALHDNRGACGWSYGSPPNHFSRSIVFSISVEGSQMTKDEILLSILKPGDKLGWVVGMPGPDVDDCEVLAIVGNKVRIKFQVWGRGPWHEREIPPSVLRWKRGGEFSQRYDAALATH